LEEQNVFFNGRNWVRKYRKDPLPYQEIYQNQDKVDYYLNEEKVIDKWLPEIIRKNV